ncbi:MAG TPA: hypothetical protein PKI03_18675 [Pseudomonadota bacterium]|nr:hypothetical protein [Pseudomonadota bacterium]
MQKCLKQALYLLLVLPAIGCGSMEQSICDKRVTCEGGNDKDRRACVDRYVGQAQVAAAYGCSDAWSKWLSCLDTSGVCSNAKITSSCDAQSQAATACMDAAASPNFR